MKQRDIRVGGTYRNRGKGKTHRKVLDIWLAGLRDNLEIVTFERIDGQYKGTVEDAPLASFARWAGAETEWEKP
jgi:hypothetical protein